MRNPISIRMTKEEHEMLNRLGRITGKALGELTGEMAKTYLRRLDEIGKSHELDTGFFGDQIICAMFLVDKGEMSEKEFEREMRNLPNRKSDKEWTPNPKLQ